MSDPVRSATLVLFARYEALIRQEQRSAEANDDPRLSLDNLVWLCERARQPDLGLPIDKLSRWLGFVQGCLAMRGLISVDEERDLSRPLLHDAYRKAGERVPAQQERPGSKPDPQKS